MSSKDLFDEGGNGIQVVHRPLARMIFHSFLAVYFLFTFPNISLFVMVVFWSLFRPPSPSPEMLYVRINRIVNPSQKRS